MTRDPLGESGSWGLYSFVGQDPLDYIDLLGMLAGSLAYTEISELPPSTGDVPSNMVAVTVYPRAECGRCGPLWCGWELVWTGPFSMSIAVRVGPAASRIWLRDRSMLRTRQETRDWASVSYADDARKIRTRMAIALRHERAHAQPFLAAYPQMRSVLAGAAGCQYASQGFCLAAGQNALSLAKAVKRRADRSSNTVHDWEHTFGPLPALPPGLMP